MPHNNSTTSTWSSRADSGPGTSPFDSSADLESGSGLETRTSDSDSGRSTPTCRHTLFPASPPHSHPHPQQGERPDMSAAVLDVDEKRDLPSREAGQLPNVWSRRSGGGGGEERVEGAGGMTASGLGDAGGAGAGSGAGKAEGVIDDARPGQAGAGAGDEDDLGPRLGTARIVVLAIIMLLTFFLGAAASSSVTLLIPPIGVTFNIPEVEAQWVSSAYTLAYGCGLLFSGRLADIFGRRHLYLSGLIFFAACCLPSALVRNLVALCVLRALAGLGLSIASSAGFGIVGTTVRHEPARTVVFATFGLGTPVGSAVGTLIGGVIAGTGGDQWTYLFYLLMGLALLVAILAFFVAPRDPPRAPNADLRVDWLGGLMITAAVCLFTFSLTSSAIAGWTTPYVPALLVTSLVLFLLFILWSLYLERRTSYPPIIKMSLFSRHSHRISFVCLGAFFACLSVSGWILLTSLFYQSYKEMSPLDNAIHIVPSSALGVFAAASMMYLASRVRAPYLLIPGMLLTSLGSLLYAVWPVGLTYWAMEFPAQLCMPWGIDYMMGLGNILMSNLLRQDEQSTGGGLFHTAGQVGAALGICLSALIANQAPGLLGGLRAAFWFTTTCGLVVVGLVVVGLRKVGLAKDAAREE